MAPLYKCLRDTAGIDARLISTGQHRQMLDQVFEWFDLRPDADLGLMKPNQTLASVISGGVAGLDELILDRADLDAPSRSDDERDHRGGLLAKRWIIDRTGGNRRQLVDELLKNRIERHDNLRQYTGMDMSRMRASASTTR